MLMNKRYGVGMGNFLTRMLREKAQEILPTRIKRLFYIGSVIGVLFSKDPDPAMLSRINEALKVAYGANSMLFPAYFSDRIWADLVLEQNSISNIKDLDVSEKWKICLLFAHRCPTWLQYGTEQLMASDIYEAVNRATLRRIA